MMIISALPLMLASSKAIGPFFQSLYMLPIGAAQFKPNISGTVMDQNPHKIAHIITTRRLARRSSSTPGSSSTASCCGFTAHQHRRLLRVLGDVFAHGGLKRFRRNGFRDIGKPSLRKAAGSATEYGRDDEFVNGVRRTFQTCGTFLFQPIWQINDGALGAAANTLTAGMDTNGLPNDLLDNLMTYPTTSYQQNPLNPKRVKRN
ncbi:hypothetical protein DL770_000208 [Monosporascus sp. CRB-9-2]|nr:hypothetical protein DL770_000208 [Monosporascus sp. CRB-9-2]